MNDLTEPLPAAVNGLRTAFDGIERAFGTHEAALASISFINTFLNAVVGLLVTVAVVAFFAHLLCWVFAKREMRLYQESIRGAFRSAIVLFLMINIWGIIKLVNNLLLLSDVTAYAVFFCAFLLLGFWALFSAGDGAAKLISRAVDGVLGLFVLGLRKVVAGKESVMARWVYTADQKILNLIVLVALIILTSLFSFSYLLDEPSSEVTTDVPASLWGPLNHPIDSVLVTFPPEWEITRPEDMSSLHVSATHASSSFALFGGLYEGALTESGSVPPSEIFLLMNNSVIAYVDNGWLLQSFFQDRAEIGGEPATMYSMYVSNQDAPSSGIALTELIFGWGREYYILSLTTYLDGTSDAEQLEFHSKSWLQVFNSLPTSR